MSVQGLMSVQGETLVQGETPDQGEIPVQGETLDQLFSRIENHTALDLNGAKEESARKIMLTNFPGERNKIPRVEHKCMRCNKTIVQCPANNKNDFNIGPIPVFSENFIGSLLFKELWSGKNTYKLNPYDNNSIGMDCQLIIKRDPNSVHTYTIGFINGKEFLLFPMFCDNYDIIIITITTTESLFREVIDPFFRLFNMRVLKSRLFKLCNDGYSDGLRTFKELCIGTLDPKKSLHDKLHRVRPVGFLCSEDCKEKYDPTGTKTFPII